MSSNIQRRGSSSSSSSSSRKQRRRSRPRSLNPLNINVAEARRQVYHALILHRTSSKSSFQSSSSSSSSHDVVSGTSTQLLQSMPLPEPVWSTTAPSVPPHVPYSGGPAMEAADIEFEWGENQASSYTWWLAFLKTLDGNNSTTSTVPQEFKYPLALGSSNLFFGRRPGGNFKVEEADEQIPSPDEWLIIPTTENHEGEFNHVIP
ncbi:hypothetical protein RchiOBHm_Chr3g0461071 [Rosa chinensis]|uniref:Uncharacterized protein n=1 Tax=Rosa chinensis TaxID=74649 RepID=A0A2P6R8K9_ROSCH|nr:hypothetical protein RchiOBHm_Chr3g0461071 [Rosa chinensis]